MAEFKNRAARRGENKQMRIGAMRADFRVTTWLNSLSPYEGKIGKDGPIPNATGMNNLQVLALLIALNGFNAKVSGWGRFAGPFGLTQQDAFLLMEMGPYLQGLIDGSGLDSIVSLKRYLEPELARLAEVLEQQDIAARVAAAEDKPLPVNGLVEGGEVRDSVEQHRHVPLDAPRETTAPVESAPAGQEGDAAG